MTSNTISKKIIKIIFFDFSIGDRNITITPEQQEQILALLPLLQQTNKPNNEKTSKSSGRKRKQTNPGKKRRKISTSPQPTKPRRIKRKQTKEINEKRRTGQPKDDYDSDYNNKNKKGELHISQKHTNE